MTVLDGPEGVIVSGDVCTTQPKWTCLLTDCEDGEDGGVGHKAGECGSPDAEGEQRARAGGPGVIGGRVLGGVALAALPRRGEEIGRDGRKEEEAGDDVDDDEVDHEPAMKHLTTFENK